MFKAGRYISMILMAFLFCIVTRLNGQNSILLPTFTSDFDLLSVKFDKDDTGAIFKQTLPPPSGVVPDYVELFHFDSSFQLKEYFHLFLQDHSPAGGNRSQYLDRKVFGATGFSNNSIGIRAFWVFDFENNSIKSIEYDSNSSLTFLPTKKDIIVLERNDSIKLEVFDFDLNIQKTLRIEMDWPSLIVSGQDESILMGSYKGDFDFFITEGWIEYPSCTIMKLDSNLNFSKSISIENLLIKDMQSNEDGFVYAAGTYYRLENVNDFHQDAFLLKMDAELNVVETIKLSASNFSYYDLSFSFKADQIKVFYSTAGRFPVITATFDKNLNILNQFGSDYITPVLESGSNDYYYVRSLIRGVGTVIAKVSTEETLNECIAAESCLQIEDLDLVITSNIINVEEVENYTRNPVNLEWERTPYEVLPFDCLNDEPPTPDFKFIDTLCLGGCASSSDTYNVFAQHREWLWESPGQDSIILDSLNITLCFEEAGNHKLSQTVWVLGCDYTFDQQIVVLEEIAATFENEVLCDEEPIARLQTNRNNIEALWSDGVQGIEREILESGFYEVTLSDEFCSKIVNADITFLSNSINTDLLLQLPQDTVICQQDLPFEFSIPQVSDEAYYLQNNIVDPSNIQLTAPGKYLFRAEINGCAFEAEYELEVDPCLSNIYLPTAFSPNGDGINDEYIALGLHFEIITFQVYDRWGEILHSENDCWDGTFKNKKMQNGIYFYTLEYLNTLSGEFEFKKGSFTLMR